MTPLRENPRPGERRIIAHIDGDTLHINVYVRMPPAQEYVDIKIVPPGTLTKEPS